MLYSTYGCIQHLTNAIAEGVLGAGAEISVKRVPELMSPEVAKQASEKPEQSAPVARPEELADYDAIITGSPTRSSLLSGPRHFGVFAWTFGETLRPIQFVGLVGAALGVALASKE